MLARAFGVPGYFLWNPLTFLIRSFLIEHFCSCPNCGSEDIVKDGFNSRKTMPDIQMLECNECGRDFCLRANTGFYWKHASMGELFIVSWIFFGQGSRRWTREWIRKLGKFCSLEWFERLEKRLLRYAADVSRFLDGFFQADEMYIHSFGEKLLIFGVKRSDGKIFETVLQGHSALEFASALKSAEEELGPIVDLDTDGHTSYPQATEWLGILHRPVNRSEEGFVTEEGVHSNGVENLWSHDRAWIEAARGYGSIETLERAVKTHQVFHNQIKESPFPVWSFLTMLFDN
ncbi:hypothetical protein AKJ51_04245 [candidate division MSBL1 archaeon SCGC-AAA382A20]|uniref:DDE domain-containing protein n=1 Tax=candidate division MSBL1 archaeon SCGC-AAA382A20 TaxID=1698280 RepID=A0A133VI18_9EURY|nr:hypothetical protein AKJ51_04245 [candidate division MSBL1 archaeon SCGC-AAA382A20]